MSVIAGAAVIAYGTAVVGWKMLKWLASPQDPPPEPTENPLPAWSKEEVYEATAAAFSAISGVKIISEKDVEKQRELGKPVKPLEIKDIFYKKPSTYWDGKGQEPLYYIPDSAYDPQYDQDFTNYKGDDEDCTRGGYRYTRPSGWNRKAVKVLGKYEDDIWLGQGGWRSGSSRGEWPVSYHGTKIQNVASIVTDGYDNKKWEREVYGRGIYSTPDLKVAEYYATQFNYKGESCTCILQNRVNLKKTKVVEPTHGTYFVTPDEDDIRPYGVCIKKIKKI
jgi:hypothetical protein